jgi:putative transposase
MIQVQLKLRLRPAQERQLNAWLYRLTGVWNWAIRKLEADGAAGIRYSVYDFKRLVTGHSKKAELPAYVLGGMLAQAWDAHSRWRNGLARRPHLKGRRNRLNSVPFSNGFPVGAGSALVPYLGRTRFHQQIIPAGHVGQARIVKRASGWYLCLFIQSDREPIAPVLDGEVGIDPGFSSLLTLSSGEVVDHPQEYRVGAKRLGQAQRGKRKHLVARLQERQANRRKDRNHKLSLRMVQENSVIAWSKDNTAGLARQFGKSVSGATHQELRRMLAYKSRAGGREFVEVPSRNSTRTCSACRALTGPTGYAGLSVRQWVCGHCGTVHDRDVNAALNTLAGAGAALERRRETATGIAIRSKTARLIVADRDELGAGQ